jgi:hypothetical protein
VRPLLGALTLLAVAALLLRRRARAWEAPPYELRAPNPWNPPYPEDVYRYPLRDPYLDSLREVR